MNARAIVVFVAVLIFLWATTTLMDPFGAVVLSVLLVALLATALAHGQRRARR
jgi:peptidoglycan/LPS O-acetylase OafA/YrhL